MNMITNHLPTAELQRLDAAHHFHPFTDKAGRKGTVELVMPEAASVTGVTSFFMTKRTV